MSDRHVTIAGAGPSGLAAAIALARAGLRVTVLERAKTVGSKFIDGFQLLENYTVRRNVLDEIREFGIEPDFVQRPGTHVDFYDHRLKRYRARSAEPFGYYVKRGPGPGTLDSSLLEQARRAGAEVFFDHGVSNLSEVDLVATGPKAADGVAREIVFSTDLPEGFHTLLDANLLGTGFAYLFVIEGQATLGVALMRDFPTLPTVVEQVTERFQTLAPFDIRNPVTKSTHVNFFLRAPQPIENPSRLAVGEAAGFQDFLWGIGIRRSLTSGYLGAQSLAHGLDFNTATHRAVIQSMNISILNRWAYELSARAGYRPFLALASRFDFRAFGLLLTRPDPIRLAAARLVRAFWKNRAECKHGPTCVWCRTARAQP